MSQHDACTCDAYAKNGDNPCPCQCDRCRAFREKVWLLHRVKAIEERLKKAGIEPADFAEMIRRYLEYERNDWLERKVAELAKEEVRRILKGLRIQSEVWRTSLDEL